jgi:hypothetical protein
MAQDFDADDLASFEAKETSHRLPVGWLLLFWGLVAWGAWFVWSHTPSLGGRGWLFADVEAGGASLGSNLLWTVAFTAIPTAVAVGLILAQRRKRR